MKSAPSSLYFILYFALIFSQICFPQPTKGATETLSHPYLQDSLIPEMWVIHKRTGKIKKRFKLGKKLAYWIHDSHKKNRGVLAYIGPDSVQFNQYRYAWEEIRAISPGRYHIGLREFMVLLVIASIAWGAFLGVLALPYGIETIYLLLFTPTLFFPILSSALTRKFKHKKFQFGPSESILSQVTKQ